MTLLNLFALIALLAALPLLMLGWIGTARAAHLIARQSVLMGDQVPAAGQLDSADSAASGEPQKAGRGARQDPAGALLDPSIARALQARSEALARGKKTH